MPIQPAAITTAIRDELSAVTDPLVRQHIEKLLVEPKPVMRAWDYGAQGEAFLCWTVFEDRGIGIAYCEQGFGPRRPWGLVFLDGGSIGMDSGWYPRFLQAVVEGSLDDLPIWRVYKTVGDICEPITPRGGWDETWARVMELRESDAVSRYDCDTDALTGRSPERAR